MVNPAHLDFLTEPIEVAGRQMAIVHIYSEAPAYRWVDASGEGITARRRHRAGGARLSRARHARPGGPALERARLLLETVMYLQTADGDYYNFLRDRAGTINEDGPTSYEDWGWWAARGQRALARGYAGFREVDPAFAARLREAYERGEGALERALDALPPTAGSLHGVRQPAGLLKGGTDVSSLALLGLAEWYEARAERQDPAARLPARAGGGRIPGRRRPDVSVRPPTEHHELHRVLARVGRPRRRGACAAPVGCSSATTGLPRPRRGGRPLVRPAADGRHDPRDRRPAAPLRPDRVRPVADRARLRGAVAGDGRRTVSAARGPRRRLVLRRQSGRDADVRPDDRSRVRRPCRRQRAAGQPQRRRREHDRGPARAPGGRRRPGRLALPHRALGATRRRRHHRRGGARPDGERLAAVRAAGIGPARRSTRADDTRRWAAGDSLAFPFTIERGRAATTSTSPTSGRRRPHAGSTSRPSALSDGSDDRRGPGGLAGDRIDRDRFGRADPARRRRAGRDPIGRAWSFALPGTPRTSTSSPTSAIPTMCRRASGRMCGAAMRSGCTWTRPVQRQPHRCEADARPDAERARRSGTGSARGSCPAPRSPGASPTAAIATRSPCRGTACIGGRAQPGATLALEAGIGLRRWLHRLDGNRSRHGLEPGAAHARRRGDGGPGRRGTRPSTGGGGAATSSWTASRSRRCQSGRRRIGTTCGWITSRVRSS